MKQTADGEGYLSQYAVSLIAATHISKIMFTASSRGKYFAPIYEMERYRQRGGETCLRYVGCR